MLFANHKSEGGITPRYFAELSDLLGRQLPQCDERGRSEYLKAGGGYLTLVAPGFEYCLDAPEYIPTGSHFCNSVQPYLD